MENSMEKHRRLMKQGSQIAEFHAAFGKEPTMDKFRIKSEKTLESILKREGNHGQGRMANYGALQPGLYPNSDSLFDALVRRIASNITGLLAKVDSLQEELAQQKQLNRELQERLGKLPRQHCPSSGASCSVYKIRNLP